MAFPTVAGRANTARSTTNSPVINLPAGITAGELLLVFAAAGQISQPATWPEGWTVLSAGGIPGASAHHEIGYRIADGSEGSSITLNVSGGSGTPSWLARSWRIQTHDHASAPPEFTTANGSGVEPDPPELSPSWGSDDTLWIAAFYADNVGPTTGFPSGYDNTAALASLGSSNAVHGGVAERLLHAASEDPGVFTGPASNWRAFTIAIRSPFPVVRGRASNVLDTPSSNFDAELPSGIVAGELLLVIVGTTPLSGNVTFPEGWTRFEQGGNGTFGSGWGYRIADGSEGASISLTRSGSPRWVSRSWRIANHGHASIAPERANVVANNLNPNPPSLAPSWGEADTLWLAVCGSNVNMEATAYPAGFSQGISLRPDGTNPPSMAFAERSSRAASLDPGAFTISAEDVGRAWTVAIAPLLEVSGSAELPVPEAQGVVYDPNISGAALLPVPVASGVVYEHPIRAFRVLQHLLPRALAWRTTVDKTLRRYLYGLGRFADGVRKFIDLVYLDLFPGTTRELDRWATQFALAPGNDASRRLALAGAWLARGGQSPDYLQSVIHAAGFTTVFVHEWWESTEPFVARDPRDYTEAPIFGEYQCEGTSPWECFDPGPGDPLGAHCDDSLANDPGYLVNLDLTRRPPPPIPADEDAWRYFIYFAGETFPEPAVVDPDRLDELKALLLSLCPAQQWIVLIQEPPS